MGNRFAAYGVALLAAAGVVLGGAAPASAIAGGSNVPDGRYTFSVKLTMLGIPDGDGTRDSSCTGSLLTPQWVITAGHCFKDASGRHVGRTVAERTAVTVGRANLAGKRGRVGTVVAVKQAPNQTDIALARISPPITDIAPIHLRDKAPKVGTTVRLAGFGNTGRDKPNAKVLQTGEFEVVSRTSSLMGVSGRKPSRTTSPCEHDSGGPYFTLDAKNKAELVAVVSRGPSCPHSGVDTASRVDAVEDWIASIVGRANLNRPFVAPKPPPRTTAPKPSTASRDTAAASPGDPDVPSKLMPVALAGGSGLLVAGVGVAVWRATRYRRRDTDPSGIRSHRR